MNFLPDVYVLCEVCNGRRYNQETLGVKFNGYSIADILDLPIEDAVPVLKDIPAVNQKLQTLVDVGLGYVHLGQSATTLSGGEAQRMKLAKELSKRQTGKTLYLLDEPTTGLHFDDVRRLLEVLHRLTDLGNTVVIIEHNLDIIRNADYLIDLGPEGGEGGGRIVAQGAPEVVARNEESHTGKFLARYYDGAENGASAASLPPVELPDLAKKAPKQKRAAPEKKTGVPTPSKKKPEARAVKTTARRAAAKAEEEMASAS
jgi:excinuclease ABC subunit A